MDRFIFSYSKHVQASQSDCFIVPWMFYCGEDRYIMQASRVKYIFPAVHNPYIYIYIWKLFEVYLWFQTQLKCFKNEWQSSNENVNQNVAYCGWIVAIGYVFKILEIYGGRSMPDTGTPTTPPGIFFSNTKYEIYSTLD